MATVLTSMLEVFMAVGEWIPEAMLALIPMFWAAETGLTFIGVLAVGSLGFSVVFLLIGIIQGFLAFRSR